MRLLTVVALSIALTGCGTAVYTHKVAVTINDPSNRLGLGAAAAFEVSLFDHTMGYSEEWARRTMGVAAPFAPYPGEVSDTATKMAFDSSLPEDMSAGLFLPALTRDGAFILEIRPVEGPEQVTTLPYRSFSGAAAEVQLLPARFTSKAADKGWTIQLTVDVPPAGDPKP
jgi:hypothetical protein